MGRSLDLAKQWQNELLSGETVYMQLAPVIDLPLGVFEMARRKSFVAPNEIRIVQTVVPCWHSVLNDMPNRKVCKTKRESLVPNFHCCIAATHKDQVNSLLRPLLTEPRSDRCKEAVSLYQALTGAAFPRSLQRDRYTQRLNALQWLSTSVSHKYSARLSMRFRILRIATRHAIDSMERRPLLLNIAWSRYGISDYQWVV